MRNWLTQLWRLRIPMICCLLPGDLGRLPVQQWGRKKRGQISFSAFCSLQALSGLDDAYPHWERQSTLLSLQVQMLISGNTLTDHTEVMFNLGTTWPAQLTHKMNHHGRWPQETQGGSQEVRQGRENSTYEQVITIDSMVLETLWETLWNKHILRVGSWGIDPPTPSPLLLRLTPELLNPRHLQDVLQVGWPSSRGAEENLWEEKQGDKDAWGRKFTVYMRAVQCSCRWTRWPKNTGSDTKSPCYKCLENPSWLQDTVKCNISWTQLLLITGSKISL